MISVEVIDDILYITVDGETQVIPMWLIRNGSDEEWEEFLNQDDQKKT